MSNPASILESAPLAGTPPHPTRTFARRRLLLGISGVGGSVVFSFLWLSLLLTGIIAVPADFRLIPGPIGASLLGTAATATVFAMLVFAVHTVLLFGLEFVGGVQAVRQTPTRAAWFKGWLRGVAVQAVLFGGFAFALALGASVLGWIGAVGATVGGGVTLLLLQGLLARVAAPLPLSAPDAALSELSRTSGIRPDVLRVVDAPDEAFVGGWVGLLKPQLWIPRAWTGEEHRELLSVQLARRYAQFSGGARRRALWRAVAWPATGVALFAPLLPWAWTDPTLWLALPAMSTLWTFAAVLLLPSLSRPVVYSADAAAAARLGVEPVLRAVRQLDAWQDDEPHRSPGVEFIFHPVPSRGNRERALLNRRRPTLGGAHQQTRLTLFASLSGLGLLGRAVHCNIGRPSLWVVYPGD